MGSGGSLHAFLAIELYRRVLRTRYKTHSLREPLYKTIIRSMERPLMTWGKENPVQNI
jgi:hypothetical protein